MSFKRLQRRAKKNKIKVTRYTGYLVEWTEPQGTKRDCVCENLCELEERIRFIEKIRGAK